MAVCVGVVESVNECSNLLTVSLAMIILSWLCFLMYTLIHPNSECFIHKLSTGFYPHKLSTAFYPHISFQLDVIHTPALADPCQHHYADFGLMK